MAAAVGRNQKEQMKSKHGTGGDTGCRGAAPLLGEFDAKYHANLNRGACMRDTDMPCKICGWGPHMQIHDPANFNVKGYGHAYSPNSYSPPSKDV